MSVPTCLSPECLSLHVSPQSSCPYMSHPRVSVSPCLALEGLSLPVSPQGPCHYMSLHRVPVNTCPRVSVSTCPSPGPLSLPAQTAPSIQGQGQDYKPFNGSGQFSQLFFKSVTAVLNCILEYTRVFYWCMNVHHRAASFGQLNFHFQHI